jgi:hypothetical protein
MSGDIDTSIGGNPTEREVAAALNDMHERGLFAAAPPPVALNELYVSRVTGEEYCVVSVLIGHAHLRDRSGCVRHWSFERIARDLMLCDPSRPKGTAPVDLAAENAALREALAASGELLAEAHAEIERLRGAK